MSPHDAHDTMTQIFKVVDPKDDYSTGRKARSDPAGSHLKQAPFLPSESDDFKFNLKKSLIPDYDLRTEILSPSKILIKYNPCRRCADEMAFVPGLIRIYISVSRRRIVPARFQC